MRRVIPALLLVVCLFSNAYAQDKALLYEVTRKDLAQPSYIFGTFHLVCPADLIISDAAKKAIADSKQLYLELDFDDPGLQRAMITSMLMTDGKTLKDFLKQEDYALLDEYLRGNVGIGLGQLGAVKPMALLSMMFVGMLKCQPVSYDLTFAEMAGKAGKEIQGLETLEQQLALLDKIPIDQQLKGLLDMVRKPVEAQKEISELMAAYRAQDVDLLMKLIGESKFDAETPGFKEDMLDKRNSEWIPLIERAARNQSTFFAFGAGHLGGPNGVIHLLRQKGFTLKPLP
jgi:uncharacterized protein YbaP (TraB family)